MRPETIYLIVALLALVVFVNWIRRRGEADDVDVVDGPAPPPGWVPARRDSGLRSGLRLVLVIWALAYPVLSCAPMFATGTDSAGGAAVGGLAVLVVGATLFLPWIVGLIVLGVLYAVIR